MRDKITPRYNYGHINTHAGNDIRAVQWAISALNTMHIRNVLTGPESHTLIGPGPATGHPLTYPREMVRGHFEIWNSQDLGEGVAGSHTVQPARMED